MSLKPQDVLIVLKLCVIRNLKWSYSFLSGQLLISLSETHAAVRRAVVSHLLDPVDKVPIIQSIEEFLIFGLRYAFPVQIGGLVNGMPTGYGAPPLTEQERNADEPPPVWADGEGQVLGYDLSPIYCTVPDAARIDIKLYELLALVDALRIGEPRERGLAGDILVKQLRNS